jgi:hypothetical protein
MPVRQKTYWPYLVGIVVACPVVNFSQAGDKEVTILNRQTNLESIQLNSVSNKEMIKEIH